MRTFLHTLLLALLLGGCDRGSEPAAPKARPRTEILATVYPMAELARRVGGEKVDVQWLVEGGNHPEAIEADASLVRRATRAKVVLTSGPWDAWALQEVADAAREQHLVMPQSLASAAKADPRAYLWLDPQVAIEIVEATRHRLTMNDTASEQEFQTGAAAIRRELLDLDQQFKEALARRKGARVLAVRPVWSAMLARYGLVMVAPVTNSEEQLSDADLKKLTQTAKELGESAILVDAATPVAVRQRIASRTGLKVLMLDAMGTSAPAGRSTYVRLMRYNLEELLKYWQ